MFAFGFNPQTGRVENHDSWACGGNCTGHVALRPQPRITSKGTDAGLGEGLLGLFGLLAIVMFVGLVVMVLRIGFVATREVLWNSAFDLGREVSKAIALLALEDRGHKQAWLLALALTASVASAGAMLWYGLKYELRSLSSIGRFLLLWALTYTGIVAGGLVIMDSSEMLFGALFLLGIWSVLAAMVLWTKRLGIETACLVGLLLVLFVWRFNDGLQTEEHLRERLDSVRTEAR